MFIFHSIIHYLEFYVSEFMNGKSKEEKLDGFHFKVIKNA